MLAIEMTDFCLLHGSDQRSGCTSETNKNKILSFKESRIKGPAACSVVGFHQYLISWLRVDTVHVSVRVVQDATINRIKTLTHFTPSV